MLVALEGAQAAPIEDNPENTWQARDRFCQALAGSAFGVAAGHARYRLFFGQF